MKKILLVAALTMASAGAWAADAASCSVQAGEKKLAGAAKNSFVKKCATDACNAAAAEKKLAGAAKNSFTKKCVADATAPAAAK